MLQRPENASFTRIPPKSAKFQACKVALVPRSPRVGALAEKAAAGRGVPTETCESVPWWHNGSLDSLELLMLDADGFLSKGCGIAIGNLRQASIKTVVESFDAQKHPVFSVLTESGPIGLARHAETLGYRLKDNYADKCHLCQEASEALRSKYPQYLQPDQHYRQSVTRDLDKT